jgi:hypothetical protein
MKARIKIMAIIGPHDFFSAFTGGIAGADATGDASDAGGTVFTGVVIGVSIYKE